jgi:hypothetical protein
MIMFFSCYSVQYIVNFLPIPFFHRRIDVYIATPTLTPKRQMLCICA